MRFIEAVRPRAADGLVADVYGEVRHDFALLRDPAGNSPFMVHSACPELLAGVWSVLYETLLVQGAVPRADKEAIAAAVSRANDCPFCVEAHAVLSEVAGARGERSALIGGATEHIGDERRRELVAWAAATREPGSELLRRAPFGPLEAPEVIGTALAFHYVNRMVEVFQGHGGISVGPGPLRGAGILLVGQLARRALRRERAPGRSLQLLPDAELPDDLRWATPSPTIASALARFVAAVQRGAEGALSPPERERVCSVLADWDGADPPLHGDWLERAAHGLEPGSQAPARLALLTALAPHRVDHTAVEAFRRVRGGDRQLVSAAAWSALAAARRIASWLAPHSLAAR
jgi:AhpD family alkylhydroperoxidase